MRNHITFHPQLGARFNEFGIGVPIIDDRPLKIIENLKEKVELADLEKIQPLTESDLKNVHAHHFIDDFFSSKFSNLIYDIYDLQNYGIKVEQMNANEFRDHLLKQGGASYYGIKQAQMNGFHFFLGGGMYHARFDRGNGFCAYHDFLAAFSKAGIPFENLLVIDIDAHQGDGTADIGNRLGVQTVSFHMKDGWPLNDDSLEKIEGTVDIGIDTSSQNDIIKITHQALAKINFEKVEFVIVVAGTDAYEKDQLIGTSELKFSLETMVNWQLEIYRSIKSKKLPQYWLLAGGYGPNSWEPTSHFINQLL